MPLDLERPTLERGFAFPKQFAVTMHVLPVTIVLRGIIAEQAQIKEVGRAREEFEGREIAFVQRRRVGPDPADAMFFEKTNHLRPMPAGMAKLDRKTEIARKLREKSAQNLAPIFRRERGRQLNEDDLELRCERLDRAEKRIQLRVAIAELAGVGDFARKFAGKAKRRRRVLDPTANSRFGGDVIKGGIDFDGGKIIRVELEPARGREFGRFTMERLA